MDDLIKTAGFAISDATETSDERGPLVRIDFEGPSDKLKLKFTKAWITLRPSEDWSIQKGEYTLKEDWRILHENSYVPDARGIPRLSRSSDIYIHPPHENRDYYDYTFENFRDKVVPESEFTLSAFGLPEPTEPMASNYRSRSHYWFIGGGIILLVGALVLHRRSRVIS